MEPKPKLSKVVYIAVIGGNILFVCWILFNGIQENFQGTKVEKASYLLLMILLVFNSILIFRKTKND